MQNRIFSTNSAKAIKAQGYGYINAIQYLAPASLSGKNLCPHASPGCIALCLGWFSGQASMVADLDKGSNGVRASRITKSQRFMKDRAGYLLDVVRAIDLLMERADKAGKRLCVRLNGSSDIAWEGIRFSVGRHPDTGRAMSVCLGDGVNIFEHYHDIEFVDYTKNAKRFDRALPSNYHLVFSRSETDEAQALALLARGINVAVVFASDCKPALWNGYTVIDGDEHDLRQLDPRGTRGFVIGLKPKGSRAKRDTSGFVVR